MTKRVLIIGGVVVAALVAVGVVLTLRDSSRPVSLEEARERAGASTTADASESDAPVRPAPGVYRYEGDGSESLSVPPLSQSQGPTMPGTVEWVGDDCWSFRIDFSTNHWQQWNYCDDDGDVIETGGQSWQRWMIGTAAVTNLSDFACEDTAAMPADPEPDEQFGARCVGTNEQSEGETISEGPYRFVGEEQVTVGDTTVLAHRFSRERAMSGAQTGTERSEVWFARDTGLPVRNERTIEVVADTPLGSSTYREQGSFVLVSPTPE